MVCGIKLYLDFLSVFCNKLTADMGDKQLFILFVDINECIEETYDCEDSFDCSNTAGGYECVCATNLVEVDGVCLGKNCLHYKYSCIKYVMV